VVPVRILQALPHSLRGELLERDADARVSALQPVPALQLG